MLLIRFGSFGGIGGVHDARRRFIDGSLHVDRVKLPLEVSQHGLDLGRLHFRLMHGSLVAVFDVLDVPQDGLQLLDGLCDLLALVGRRLPPWLFLLG